MDGIFPDLIKIFDKDMKRNYYTFLFHFLIINLGEHKV